MLKIDVLCVFFLYNNNLVKELKGTKRLLLSYDLLGKVFDLDSNYIAKMSRNFKQN